jgi:hypothetical protein
MIFPSGYVIALNTYRRELNFPNLKLANFSYESLRDEDYNCVAWIHGAEWIDEIEDAWVQFKDDYGNWDVSLNRYIQYFREFGYEVCQNKFLEDGYLKIALYFDNKGNEFKHVARQLPDGKWASKLGDWEDIIHENIEVLLGKLYGNDLLIMQKPVV